MIPSGVNVILVFGWAHRAGEKEGIKRSPLELDLYMWLFYRTITLRKPVAHRLRDLYRQLGAHPSEVTDIPTVNDFRKACLRELKKIEEA